MSVRIYVLSLSAQSWISRKTRRSGRRTASFGGAQHAGNEENAGKAGQVSGASARAKAALEQFVKKCLYLAAKRITELCLRLLLESALTQQVWEVALDVDKPVAWWHWS